MAKRKKEKGDQGERNGELRKWRRISYSFPTMPGKKGGWVKRGKNSKVDPMFFPFQYILKSSFGL